MSDDLQQKLREHFAKRAKEHDDRAVRLLQGRSDPQVNVSGLLTFFTNEYMALVDLLTDKPAQSQPDSTKSSGTAKRITLTEENFKVLQRCVEFCLKNAQQHQTVLGLKTDIGEADLLNLQAAIKLCTEDVKV
jgi:hypothetical protein